MRLLLIFPPSADPALPPGGIAALAAAVQVAGVADVRVRDLNVEAFHRLLNRDVLQREVEAVETSKEPQPIDSRIQKCLTRASEVLERIDDAIACLKSPDCFYDPPRLFYAKRIFHFACELLSMRFPGHTFGKYTYCNTETELASFEQIERWVRIPGPLTEYLVDVAPDLLCDQPDVIGISVCYSAQLVPAFVLADVLKRLSPGVHIIMGGPIITWGKHILEQDIRFSRWLDSFCLGEAEEHLPLWLDALAGRSARSTVKDIVFYDGDCVVNTSDPSYRLDLDRLPTPDFTQFPLDKYFAPAPIFCLTPARGCYYNKCSFCNYAYIKLATYRMRDPRLVARDVEVIAQQTGSNVFCLETDILHPTHLRRISAALRERGLCVRWHGVAKVDSTMTQDLFDDLASSGCVRLFMGLESGNDRVLGLMAKGTSVADADRILGFCRRAGIHVEAGIIAGFPTETAEELEDTYRFIIRNRDALARPDIGAFRLLRGSPLAAQPAAVGIKIADAGAPSWHIIEFEQRGKAIEGRLHSLTERTLLMFPETAFVDVSEDILYHAAGLHGRFRDWSAGISPAGDEEVLAVSIVGNRQITITLEAADTSVVSIMRATVDRTGRRLYFKGPQNRSSFTVGS